MSQINPRRERAMSDTIRINVENLKPSRDVNPNRMEEDKYVLLVAGIRRFGFLQPILVRSVDGYGWEIVDGHHRLRACLEIGLPDMPCVDCTGKTDEEIKALMVSMNRNRGELDLGIVAGGLLDLSNTGWSTEELTVTGFTLSEVEDLLASTKIDADVMDQPIALADDEPAPPSEFVLEILFATKSDFSAARRALKKSAGKGGDLAAGLMRALGLDDAVEIAT